MVVRTRKKGCTMNPLSASSLPAQMTNNRHPLYPIALFEKEFSIDWAVELMNRKISDTLEILEEEIQKGVLLKKAAGIYTFNTERRKELLEHMSPAEREQGHRHVAELLMREFPDDEHKALTLAPHLLQIPNNFENSRWLLRAGDIHLKNFRNEEALQCYKKILDELTGLHGENIDFIFVQASARYSKISIGSDDTEKILDYLYDALRRAKKWNKHSCESLLEMHIAKNKWLLSKYRSALKHFGYGWNIAKKLDDPKLLRSAKTFSSFFLYWQGRFREVVESYDKSVPDVEKYPKGNYPLIAASLAAYCYCLTGQITQGLGLLNSIHEYCADKENFFAAARASLNIGKVMFEIGETDRALQYFETASKEASLGANNLVLISSKLLFAYGFCLKGENDQAVKFLKEFLSLREDVKISVQPYPYLLAILWLMEEGNFPRIPGFSFKKFLRQMMRDDNIFMRGVAYRFKVLLQKKEGLPPEKLINSISTSIKWLEESGHEIQLARSLIEAARLYLALGSQKKAEKAAQNGFQILSTFNDNLFPNDLRPLVKTQQHNERLFKEILKLGQEVVTIRNDKELVQQIISTVNRITGAERGAIFLLEDAAGGSKLQLRASKNLTMDQIYSPSFESSMKLIQEVAATGKGRVEEIDSQAKNCSCPNDVIRSKICVPMILQDRVIGVLYHDNCFLCSAFKESDLELLAYFATFAGFALEKVRAWEEVQRLNEKLQEEKLYYEEEHQESLHFEDIVGESTVIKNVLVQVNQVAKTDTTVLILGETGVGKELMARAIHRLSDRGDKPFIRLNCSSYPESLISSELFGHEKGAFTGATSRRVGRFELADSGTLFLDEVGELPLDIQIRLLQVLQFKEFERVGGSETIRSDFRLVVATNQDLQKLIDEGEFRADLYYRLNVFPIYVPPLRERKEDIPLLAYYFLKIYSAKMRKPLKVIPDEEMNRLMQYEWPGNVRELENIIERGTILSSGTKFKVPELHLISKSYCDAVRTATLEENEKQHILWAVNKTKWKIRGPGGAAELLDIHPSTLTFRMKKLGIQRPQGIPKQRANSVDAFS
jgi:formate hydrogenlyase transcriptional activator